MKFRPVMLTLETRENPSGLDPTDPTGTTLLFRGLPFLYAPVAQSDGIRATLGTPFGGTLGLTFIHAGINPDSTTVLDSAAGIKSDAGGLLQAGQGDVYGADLALNLSKCQRFRLHKARILWTSNSYHRLNLLVLVVQILYCFGGGRQFRLGVGRKIGLASGCAVQPSIKLGFAHQQSGLNPLADGHLRFGEPIEKRSCSTSLGHLKCDSVERLGRLLAVKPHQQICVELEVIVRGREVRSAELRTRDVRPNGFDDLNGAGRLPVGFLQIAAVPLEPGEQ